MKPTRQNKLYNLLQGLFYFLGLAGYLYLMLSDVTKFQRENFSEIVLENSLILAGIILFYLLTHFLPGWIASPLRWTGLLGISGVFLKGYWIIKRSAYFQVYGILPNVDAAEYYHNAIRLLTGFPAQGTTISRPFFPAFLSSILWSVKLDIHLALIILVALVIFALFLFGESVRNRFGILPAAMTVGMTFMFYSNYLGAFSSESLGLIFGCLAWVFFFESAVNPAKRYFILGMAFLILGMFTRAGALLILPTMVIAFLLFYQKKSDRIWYLASSLVVFVVIYLVNSNILDILSANSSYLFPNSLYSFYGMAAGGHGWGYFKIARPDIWAMEEPIRTQMLFQATIELIKANPLVLIVNMLKQFYYFVLLGNTSVFSYLFTTIRGYNIALLVFLYSASCWTIAQLVRKRAKLSSLILLAILAGILLSIPFVPPQDESDMRAYAVTVPVMALIPALAIQDWASSLWKRLPGRLTAKINLQPDILDHRWVNYPTIFFGAVMAALAIFPTYTMRGISKPDLPVQSACPSGQKSVSWEYQRKNSIRIVKDQEPIGIYSIRKSQVERLMHDIYFAPHLGVFQSMNAGMSVSQQINLVDGASGWFLVPDSITKTGDGVYSGCATFHDDGNFYLFDFFKVESGQKTR